jgi:hypothetical protein
MAVIRIEADGASDLSRVYLWLSRHRGQNLELDPNRRIAFGTPISGARAVIVAVALQDQDNPGFQLAGVVRAISSPTEADPVRLVFEGRSAAGIAPDKAQALATKILDAISEQIAVGELVENVA